MSNVSLKQLLLSKYGPFYVAPANDAPWAQIEATSPKVKPSADEATVADGLSAYCRAVGRNPKGGKLVVYPEFIPGLVVMDFDNVKIDRAQPFKQEPCSKKELYEIILPKIFAEYSWLKSVPYTLSRNKRLPHFYFFVESLPKFSGETKIGVNDDFEIDLLKKTCSSERADAILFNYDEENGLPNIYWPSIKQHFKITPIDDRPIVKLEPLSAPEQRASFEKNGRFIEDLCMRILDVSPNHYGSYDKWLRLGMMLKHSFGRDGWNIFDKVSSKCDGYDASKNRKSWESFGDNCERPLTIGSLIKEAKDLSISFYSQNLRTDSILTAAEDIAKLYYDLYAREHLLYDDANSLYIFDDHTALWQQAPTKQKNCLYTVACDMLRGKVGPVLNKAEKALKQEIIVMEDSKKPEAKKRVDKLQKLFTKLGDTPFQKQVWEKLFPKIIDAELCKNLNNIAPTQLPLDCRQNVCLLTGKLVERKREDYFTFALSGFSIEEDLLTLYKAEHKPQITQQGITRSTDDVLFYNEMLFINQDQPDAVKHTELINCLQQLFGYFLTGKTFHRHFYICTGEGSNGKSKFGKLLEACLGSLYQNAPQSLIVDKKRDSETSPEMKRIQNCRVSLVSEVAKEAVLNVASIKQMTGDDKITARQLFAPDHESFRTYAKVVALMNKLPKLDVTEQALLDRITVIPFQNRFIDALNTWSDSYKADIKRAQSLIAQIDDNCVNDFKNRYFNYLVAGAIKALNNPSFNKDWQGAELMQSATKDYERANNFWADWFAERVIGDERENLSLADICNDIKEWYKSTVGEGFHYSRNEIRDALNACKEFTRSSAHKPWQWKGCRLRTAADDQKEKITADLAELADEEW